MKRISIDLNTVFCIFYKSNIRSVTVLFYNLYIGLLIIKPNVILDILKCKIYLSS